MNKKSIETIDGFIIDPIEYIRKKSQKRVDEWDYHHRLRI